MFEVSRVCPDCSTALDAQSGPLRCETCWRLVAMSRRGKSGALELTGRWMRLPPALQQVRGIVEALAAAGFVEPPLTPQGSRQRSASRVSCQAVRAARGGA